jgi:DNA-binding transcriptional LysR family regulator
MTLEQLRIFVAVAQTLNMRAASEVLHLTQPAVSAAIAALELRYDTRLFDRVGRGLELNAAGRAFLPEARAVLARAEEARRALDDLTGLLRGAVRIAASQTVATYWLPVRMARFAAQHPGVGLPLVAGNSAQAVQAVLDGDADLAFIESAAEDGQLQVRPIGGDRLGFYVAPAHPLAGASIGAAELRGAEWVLREPGSGTRDHFAASLPALGVTMGELSVRLSMPSNEAALEAAAAGEMIAVVSDLAAECRLAMGKITRLDCTLPARDFSVVTHRSRRLSHAAAAFLELLHLDQAEPGLDSARRPD